MKPILFQDENEMRFWMGIYQTATQSSNSQSTLSGCDFLSIDNENNTPDCIADDAVRALRKRMPSQNEPAEKKYHNSPN